MIRRVLLCCRGEIALRFIRTCRVLRIETVVLFTEDDEGADFVLAADRAVRVGSWDPATLIETVISAALEASADAVAPGYGPLAENADFASACESSGLLFVGPHVAAIRMTGDKIAARAAAQRAKVPIAPGEAVSDDVEAAARLAAKIGYPVLLKAALGGGGRGIRVAQGPDDFHTAFAEVKQEAALAFGSRAIYLEKFLGEAVRHIEVQILGDRYGNLVHLGTRSCSVQRRRQKVVEEAPAPALSSALRTQLHDAALAMAREVRYDSAGTVEFLVDRDERFYFIEMNARIQVEHPVTEEITGVDIVAQMLRAAGGATLGVSQDELRFEGHAVEFRVCAEDAHASFLPTGGPITHYRVPEGPGIRVDSGVHAGARQSARFDSLCLKLIVRGRSRDEALRRSELALSELVIGGFSTNVPFHRWLLAHPRFLAGDYDLSFTREFTQANALPADTARLLHAAAALARHLEARTPPVSHLGARAPASSPAGSEPRASWVVRNSPWQPTS